MDNRCHANACLSYYHTPPPVDHSHLAYSRAHSVHDRPSCTLLCHASDDLFCSNQKHTTSPPLLSLYLYFFLLIIVTRQFSFFFFFNDPAPPEFSPLPLHAALPI